MLTPREVTAKNCPHLVMTRIITVPVSGSNERVEQELHPNRCLACTEAHHAKPSTQAAIAEEIESGRLASTISTVRAGAVSEVTDQLCNR